jgi:uroporphyrinogen-III decarboxylase
MTGKQKIKDSLNHKSGKIPVDFGSTAVSGIHISIIEGLRRHYGLDNKPIKVLETYQMLGEIDYNLKQTIGIDTQGIIPWKNMFGVENTGWKEWKTPWGQDVLVPGGFQITESENDILIYPQGDTSVPPSGRMPEGGFFFDSINRQEPFEDDNLKAEDNLEEFGLISDQALNYYQKQIEKLKDTELALVGDFGGTAVGDIALVPGPGLKHPKGIRDVAEWYMSTVMRQDLLHEIFDKQTKMAVKNLERIYEVIGENIQVVYICGTDFGTQNSQFCSTDTYDSLFMPYYKRINGWIHEHTSWKTFKHSCGSVAVFMPHFIEAGFDIINPVQFSATGMDPVQLKKEYGKDLVFWGGGVDTQKSLPFGTPEEVRVEILERCEIMALEGGYVFNSIHNVQAKTPIENVIAMIEAVKEFNGEN